MRHAISFDLALKGYDSSIFSYFNNSLSKLLDFFSLIFHKFKLTLNFLTKSIIRLYKSKSLQWLKLIINQ